jgi:molybdopterin synthase catalytic subunit
VDEEVEMSGDLIVISEEPISAHEISPLVRRDAAGAIVTFEGTVRDHSGDRATEYLEYEAYDEMVVKVLEKIAAAAKDKWSLLQVAIHHRTGRLVVGEVSVVIAVSAEHRGAAFDACRFIIDELKVAAPIWKKEVGPDGSEWVSGPPAGAES